MIKRGQVFVRAKKNDGHWGNVDIFDLDEDSWRCLIVSRLVDFGMLVAIRDLFAGEQQEFELHEKSGRV